MFYYKTYTIIITLIITQVVIFLNKFVIILSKRIINRVIENYFTITLINYQISNSYHYILKTNILLLFS